MGHDISGNDSSVTWPSLELSINDTVGGKMSWTELKQSATFQRKEVSEYITLHVGKHPLNIFISQ